MLTGDDLSTQYFIAGTAIAVLCVGVTQAGWTQRWFVRATLLLGFALLAAATFWGSISETFPKIASWATPIGSNSLAWLSLLFVALITVLFLDYRARTRAAGASKNAPLSEMSSVITIKNISEVQLVASGEEMVLVVSPSRGGVTIGIFVEISSWSPSLIPSDWSKPQRFYLGEMPLRAANVKFSVPVMERGPDGVVGWLWKILKSDGVPSGTRPWFINGRQRATFVFIDQAGLEEAFPLLLLPDGRLDAYPVVVAPNDFPTYGEA